MFCQKCGANLAPGAAFCNSCGTPTGNAAPSMGQQPFTQPQQPQFGQQPFAQPQQPQFAQQPFTQPQQPQFAQQPFYQGGAMNGYGQNYHQPGFGAIGSIMKCVFFIPASITLLLSILFSFLPHTSFVYGGNVGNFEFVRHMRMWDKNGYKAVGTLCNIFGIIGFVVAVVGFFLLVARIAKLRTLASALYILGNILMFGSSLGWFITGIVIKPDSEIYKLGACGIMFFIFSLVNMILGFMFCSETKKKLR